MTAARGAILFFLCLDDRGGAEIAMIRLAQGLLMQGRAVTIAAYGGQPSLACELGFTGELIDLRAKRSIHALWPLYKILRARRFPTLISALTHTNIVALIAACLAGRGTRVFVTEHGIDGIAACEASPFFARLTRFVYMHAAGVVAVSQGLAQRWRDLLPSRSKISTIYNPVINDHLTATLPPTHMWLTDKTVPAVIGIGRLRTEKNFELLIRAFVSVVATRDARLVILGEGDQRAMLETLVRQLGLSDKVLMPGFAADPTAWLAYASLFVSPSRREGFGNAIVEALAQGLPVVATDCPYGPAEILAQGRYGRLVPMDDVAAMAQAMIDALQATHDKQALVARAADFTAVRCIDLYAKLIDNPLS